MSGDCGIEACRLSGHEKSAGTALFFEHIRLPGQYFDAETGLFQNDFRDYGSGSGHYIESDPSGIEAGVNTYTYVLYRQSILPVFKRCCPCLGISLGRR
ncbi:RHS repeat-associated core domain-containing protein [Dyella acidiphila]|uniref:RHS repeat-associated core domain-containing protein n=1 Tax=Dyella acidiphila TaxID=2775866 RepID=A0ABR9GCT1_9GAMM|nr:hypothetical protein [Dyella acidiphila]